MKRLLSLIAFLALLALAFGTPAPALAEKAASGAGQRLVVFEGFYSPT